MATSSFFLRSTSTLLQSSSPHPLTQHTGTITASLYHSTSRSFTTALSYHYPTGIKQSKMFSGCFTRKSSNVIDPSLVDRCRTFASTSASEPLYLVLLGAPGVGKGTFAGKIAPHFKIPAISTGDLVRAEIKSNSELGKKIKEINDQGKLVDDSTIIEMLKKRLQQDDTKNGFLLDGFPRRVSQADALKDITKLNAVLNITLREDILINKICSRRVCKTCGTNYNLADINEGEYQMPPMKPKKEGICDKDGGELIQRSDDTEGVVRDRLKEYDEQTHPLVDYYNKQGLLINWPVKKGVADTPQILKLLEDTLEDQKKENAKPIND